MARCAINQTRKNNMTGNTAESLESPPRCPPLPRPLLPGIQTREQGNREITHSLDYGSILVTSRDYPSGAVDELRAKAKVLARGRIDSVRVHGNSSATGMHSALLYCCGVANIISTRGSDPVISSETGGLALTVAVGQSP
jgi:hypothetical protein